MDRKILLLIDNAGSHFNPKIFDETNLNEDDFNDEENNEEEMLVYLPPNTTAHLQPMDAGIIHSFKSKYKKEYCKHLIRKFDAGVDYTKNKLNLKEAIEYIADGWNNVTQKTIRNCWIKTGILPSYIDDDDVNFDLRNFEPDSDATEIEDLLDNLPETDNVRNYFQILDHEIPAEENLTEEQIVNLVQLEKKEESEEDDDSDNEIPPVSIN
ncbi:unnamed protein product [Rhizophagus irregularis]|nr:unnamed protein product [Rhizophagus irregularis]